ncbi:hypothetical protein D3C86_1973620 [compost metagenome]
MTAERQEGGAERACGHRSVGKRHAGGDRPSLGRNTLQAEQQEHHAERRQKIRHAHVDDDDAVDQSDENADRQADERCRQSVAAHHHHHIG